MATGLAVLKPFEEGSRVVSEDGSGVIKTITRQGDSYICRVLLDSGEEYDYELETLGEEIDVNKTCFVLGLCDGEVIGERQRPGDPFPEPICAEHNRFADDQGWPSELQPYRDPMTNP